ncbi:MAG: TolC family protein [Acidobacteria bacterium]|nr:TolC family protein [Acidobacteriota bacterium]
MRILVLLVLMMPALAAAQSAAPAAVQAADLRRLTVTVDEAVAMALEHNLGVQIARIDPQIQDVGVAQARAAWFPTFTSALQTSGTDTPNNSFLSGALGPKTSDDRLTTNVGVAQPLPWGGAYSVGWDSARSTTTNIFSNFSPQLRSSVALTYRQPLLRGFSIDTPRQQLLVSRKNREIADVALRQAVAQTTRAVRRAYWDLTYARAALQVQTQSLELARQSLRNTRARVEIGTTPPIDVVEAEAEMAQREEAVIVADAQIATAEDALRALMYDPSAPDFWSVRIEPVSAPPLDVRAIDPDAAARAALANRADLQQAQKNLETTGINLRYFRNQTLPDVTASVDYGVTGLGGTQFVRGSGFPGPIVGQTERGFGRVLGDLFGNTFPAWTASVSVSYPIGPTPQDASMARARLQLGQQQAQLRNQQLQVATEVREAARQVLTNQKRVETTRTARQLSERRLEAEERKLAAGTSTSFVVFQVQRDLAQARTNELRATLDYSKSLVDFDTVQEAPLR